MFKSNQHTLLLATVVVLALSIAAIDCDRQGGARRTSNSGSAKSFSSPCGTSEQVEHRIGECWKPIFDLIEGKVPTPVNDADSLRNCERFANTEKCTRQVAKDCLSGFTKTTLSAVATASKRFRTSECRNEAVRATYTDPIRCVNKRAPGMQAILRNHTAILQAIRDNRGLTTEDKVQKTCCLFNEFDRDIEAELSRECPQHAKTIIGITHAITEDAKNTLCARPKCNHAVDQFIRSKYKPPQNYIEPVMDIIFMLGTLD